jgi:CRP/FNR family transcriptional regulator, cyclic AMP receptor protein
MARRDAFIDHLQQVPLFAACSRKDLQLVARRAEDVRVGAGKSLISEGDTGHEFFVILDGTARVTRHGRKIATLGPGDAFGELALLEKAPRNSSIVADTDMELVVLGQREFAGLIDEVPGFARKLLAGMAKRLREADARSVQN